MKHRLYKSIYIISLFSFFLCSCTEVIDIDLNSTNPVVVAEGYMEPGSPASLRLTYSTDYFNMEEARVIENARIILSDQRGNSESMMYQGDGLYTSEQLRGKVHNDYTLSIEVDGKAYSGFSCLLPQADIVSIAYSKLLLGDSEASQLLGYALNVAFQEHPEMDVYYALKIKKNGVYAANTYGLASTRANDDGNFVYTSQSFFVVPGDTLELAVFSIDFEAYTYYSELNEGLSGNMIMSPAPFNARSNLGENIMGYFMARSRKDTVVVVPSLGTE